MIDVALQHLSYTAITLHRFILLIITESETSSPILGEPAKFSMSTRESQENKSFEDVCYGQIQHCSELVPTLTTHPTLAKEIS